MVSATATGCPPDVSLRSHPFSCHVEETARPPPYLARIGAFPLRVKWYSRDLSRQDREFRRYAARLLARAAWDKRERYTDAVPRRTARSVNQPRVMRRARYLRELRGW
jgi:hypothetical protein